MNIYSKCQKCNEEVVSSTNQITRGDHAMRKGEFIELRCGTCNTDNKIHIDDFKTRKSKSLQIAAFGVLVVGFILSVLSFLWLVEETIIAYGFFGIPFLAYGLMMKFDADRVSNFNRLFVKR